MPPSNLSKPIYFGSFLVTPQVFHQTPLSFALVNLKPILPGHVLISPKRRVPRIKDLTAAEITDLFSTVQRVSRTIERVFNATALNIAIQDGEEAGQSVPHIHAHIIPRKNADLDNRGGKDAVYEIMDGPEGNIGAHLEEATEAKSHKPLKVDADDARKPRTVEEMNKEAEWLTAEMAKDDNNIS
ncbi:HIT domain protein [Tothia fuscella]|uniref:Bis(5'-adenosyl)-triphosphatase n=1 Tax=Tothia fuscella TaxID=1048955 RepID=A0A9P4U133_9PEZI|nr:HIT domain protein [Tothia fuscella]